MTPKPLEDVIDALDTGIEKLREFNEWLEAGGLQTWGEWLLKYAVPDDEQPPRVIITPPPKKETPKETIDRRKADPCDALHPRPRHYDPCKYAFAAMIRLDGSRMLQGVSITHDMSNDGIVLRCHHCRSSIAFPSYEDRDVAMKFIGGWYKDHGPYCGQVRVVHNGTEPL